MKIEWERDRLIGSRSLSNDHHIDAIEGTKVIVKVLLILGSAAVGWDPKGLRVRVDLKAINPNRSENNDQD